MIRHIVMWKFKESVDREIGFAVVKRELEALVGLIEGLKSLVVSRDIGFDAAPSDLVLVADLADRVALERYQDHPAHVACKGPVSAVCTDRRCIDFEIAD